MSFNVTNAVYSPWSGSKGTPFHLEYTLTEGTTTYKVIRGPKTFAMGIGFCAALQQEAAQRAWYSERRDRGIKVSKHDGYLYMNLMSKTPVVPAPDPNAQIQQLTATVNSLTTQLAQQTGVNAQNGATTEQLKATLIATQQQLTQLLNLLQ